MEYNVFDLVKRLLKNWYIILLAMIVVSVGAVGLSQRSYEKAVEDYYAYTTETEPQKPDVGQAVALVSFDASEESLSNMRVVLGMLNSEDSERSYTDEMLKQAILKVAEPHILDMLMDTELLEGVQLSLKENGWDEEVLLTDHFYVQNKQEQTIQLVTGDLTESESQMVFEAYLSVLTENLSGLMIDIDFKQMSCTFTLSEPEFTEDAKFAQIIMQVPVEKPNMVKPALTGAIFGFAIGCIVVLFWIFAKDVAKQEQCRKKD